MNSIDLLKLRLNILSEKDPEKLRDIALLLTQCIGADGKKDGYCVVDSQSPPHHLYDGSRENCVAFIEGFELSGGCIPNFCVCVDTDSVMIVLPEERFGERLGK